MISREERRNAENRMVIAARLIMVLARIFFFVAVFGAVCAAIAVVLVLSTGAEWAIGEGKTATAGLLAVWIALWCATAVLVAVMLRRIVRLCDRVEEFGTPFVRANVGDVDFLWKALTAIGIVWGGVVPLMGLVLHADLSGSFSLLPFAFCAISIIVFLARVFEYGCALQEQDDELL